MLGPNLKINRGLRCDGFLFRRGGAVSGKVGEVFAVVNLRLAVYGFAKPMINGPNQFFAFS